MKKTVLSLGISVLCALFVFGVTAVFGVTTYGPPGTLASPTFSGLTVSGTTVFDGSFGVSWTGESVFGGKIKVSKGITVSSGGMNVTGTVVADSVDAADDVTTYDVISDNMHTNNISAKTVTGNLVISAGSVTSNSVATNTIGVKTTGGSLTINNVGNFNAAAVTTTGAVSSNNIATNKIGARTGTGTLAINNVSSFSAASSGLAFTNITGITPLAGKSLNLNGEVFVGNGLELIGSLYNSDTGFVSVDGGLKGKTGTLDVSGNLDTTGTASASIVDTPQIKNTDRTNLTTFNSATKFASPASFYGITNFNLGFTAINGANISGGLLVKGGDNLEIADNADLLFFNKTDLEPKVSEIVFYNGAASSSGKNTVISKNGFSTTGSLDVGGSTHLSANLVVDDTAAIGGDLEVGGTINANQIGHFYRKTGNLVEVPQYESKRAGTTCASGDYLVSCGYHMYADKMVDDDDDTVNDWKLTLSTKNQLLTSENLYAHKVWSDVNVGTCYVSAHNATKFGHIFYSWSAQSSSFSYMFPYVGEIVGDPSSYSGEIVAKDYVQAVATCFSPDYLYLDSEWPLEDEDVTPVL